MTLEKQLRFWVIALVALIAFLWVFSGVLTPFVAGMALAYLLDPVADALERRGLSRMAATLVILAGAILIFVLALLLVLPPLARQLVELFGELRPFIPDTLRTLFGLQEGDLAGLAELFNGTAPAVTDAAAQAGTAAGGAAPAPVDPGSGFSIEALRNRLDSVNVEAVRRFFEENAGTIANILGRIADQGAAVFGLLSVVLVTPVVARTSGP